MKHTTYFKTLSLAAALLFLSLQTFAQSPTASTPTLPTSSPVQNKGSDKVDLKKLEDKYWSAKDDEYGVIQNRTFAKTGKFYASLVYGPLVNDPAAKARAAGGMLGYFLNEDFGLEVSYLSYGSKANETVETYSSQFGATPDHNLVKTAKAISLNYTPLYAKMAFMNKGILYFDMGFTLGAGTTDYEIQKIDKNGAGTKSQSNEMVSVPHFEIGVMQQLFLSQYFAFRLDIKNSFYSQKLKQYEIGIGVPESSRLEYSKSVNDTTITFGLTVFTK